MRFVEESVQLLASPMQTNVDGGTKCGRRANQGAKGHRFEQPALDARYYRPR